MDEGRHGRLVEPQAGETVSLYGVNFTYKVLAEDTGGALSVIETVIPPRTLVKPHTHSREDEYSLVQRGPVGVRLGDQEFEAPSGSYLVKPRGIPHALWNPGPEPAIVVEILSPAGFERYFQELAPILEHSGRGWSERYHTLAEAYGITVLNDWTDELEAKYRISLRPPEG